MVYLLFHDDLIKRFIRNEIILSEFEINHKHPQNTLLDECKLCEHSSGWSSKENYKNYMVIKGNEEEEVEIITKGWNLFK